MLPTAGAGRLCKADFGAGARRGVAAGIIAGELPGHAAAARAAHQSPLQRFAARRVNLLRRRAKLGQPVAADLKVVILSLIHI